jgi:hypothetical protein
MLAVVLLGILLVLIQKEAADLLFHVLGRDPLSYPKGEQDRLDRISRLPYPCGRERCQA